LKEGLLREINDINRIGVAVDYTAHIDATEHLEVAIVAPSCTPGVLDNPVILSILSSIADSQDSMVDVHRSILASGIGVNTGLVASKAGNNLECDRNGSNHEKMVAKILLTERNVIGSTNDTNRLLEARELALLINCTVRVEIFSDKTSSILDVFESMRRKTTFTSIVIKITSTINKLLLAEISELSVLLHEV